ncbi:MAG: hypothetical protein NW201_09145 [Gemmatimonadales bacterium]|nr:hypothetical protein [Gemmatimonadales bacterium]
MTRLPRRPLLLAVLLLASCEPTATLDTGRIATDRFTLSLGTPNTGDGGVRLRITSSLPTVAPTDVTPSSQDAVAFIESVQAGEVRVAVIGRLTSGTIATLRFSSRIDPAIAFTATVEEAASGADFALRSSLSGYSATVTAAAPSGN